MALYAISDLHLPFGVNKPMDIFGESWNSYTERIRENWLNTINASDAVVVSGDISWATYIEQARADFEFLNELPGTKIISKGNHDYWWTTLKKINEFIKDNFFENFVFLHNNAYLYKDSAICSCRGWITSKDPNFTPEDEKIYVRELGRLERSIIEGLKFGAKRLVVSIHYPPFEGFMEILKKYEVDACIYGHLHGESANSMKLDLPGFYLASSDYIGFKPVKIFD